jgi:hypothetical protein
MGTTENMETTITDEFIQQTLAMAKSYCVMILRGGPEWNQPRSDKIIWEHGRRNFRLRPEGVLSIVCPVVDGSDVKGVGISTRAWRRPGDDGSRSAGERLCL